MAQKFEQGIDPAIVTSGKYTITRRMFRGGQVTHGVSKSDFEKVDPENKGVTQPEFNFFNLMKDIIESQTVNATFSGEVSGGTATEIATVDTNQKKKLAYLLDGIGNGFMDMALRLAETIESKYTIKQKETMVDGKKVSVYQNFSVNVSGIEHAVEFNEEVGTPDYDEDEARDSLFKKAFDEKKAGYQTEYYLVNPKMIRNKQYQLVIEIHPEQVKDSQLQMIQMWDEFKNLIGLFGLDKQGGMLSTEELKKQYLEVSGRPDELFTTKQYQELQDQEKALEKYNMGSFGQPNSPQQPTMKNSLQEMAKGN